MTLDIHSQRILILDFGSQYTQLIARRIREIGVYDEIRAFDMSEEEIREFLSNRIPYYMVPNYIVKVDNIPYTSNFKVDYKKQLEIQRKLEEENLN